MQSGFGKDPNIILDKNQKGLWKTPLGFEKKQMVRGHSPHVHTMALEEAIMHIDQALQFCCGKMFMRPTADVVVAGSACRAAWVTCMHVSSCFSVLGRRGSCQHGTTYALQ